MHAHRAVAIAALVAAVAPRAARAQSCSPNCPVARAEVRISAGAKGRWRPGFAMRALSLRGSVERTRLGDGDRTAASFGVEERALAYMSLGALSARYTDIFALGGGNAGVDGGLGVDAALGFQPKVAGRHGPLGRLGVRAHWLHRGYFHSSVFELPQAQLGYGYVSRTVHVEAAVRGGPVLTGRFGVDGGSSARLGDSLEVGGYVALAVKPLRLDVEASRIRLDAGPSGPVDSVQAMLCGVLGHPTVCFHSALLRGHLVAGSTLHEASAAYVGVTIGFGPVEWR